MLKKFLSSEFFLAVALVVALSFVSVFSCIQKQAEVQKRAVELAQERLMPPCNLDAEAAVCSAVVPENGFVDLQLEHFGLHDEVLTGGCLVECSPAKKYVYRMFDHYIIGEAGPPKGSVCILHGDFRTCCVEEEEFWK